MRGSTRSEDSHSHDVREQDEEEERVLHDVIRSSEISIWKAAGGVEQQMHSPLSEKSVREGLDFAA